MINSSKTQSIWQIGLFACNNAATNCYMILLNMVSYYTFGPAGMLMSVLLNVATVMRIFDGFTDPFIGTLIDKTQTRFGKYRPFMIIGQLIMLGSVLILFTLVNKIPNTFLAYLVFTLVYAVYILGYTCQTACTKAGQTIITQDPKLRPLMALFDTSYTVIIFTTFGMVLPYLASKYGGLSNQSCFNTMMLIYMPLSFLLTVLAVIGIWAKDNNEFYIKNARPIKFKDFIKAIKHNKAIQMLVISAASDKLAQTIAGNTLITTLLFGIILGNYNISSYLSIPISLATIVAIFLGTIVSRKSGQKKAFVYASIFSIISAVFLFIVMIIINPKGNTLSLASISGVFFMIAYILLRIGISLTGGIVIPMIADCSDYEVMISGKAIPGLIGTLFSFIDKLVSSLATSILSLMLIWAIGAGGSLDVNMPYSNKLFIVFMIGSIIIPIIGWVINIIAMLFYPLDRKKMEEVSANIKEHLNKAN